MDDTPSVDDGRDLSSRCAYAEAAAFGVALPPEDEADEVEAEVEADVDDEEDDSDAEEDVEDEAADFAPSPDEDDDDRLSVR